MQIVEGVIEEIIYRNDDNGYCVLSVFTETDEVTLVGTMFNLSVGEEIRATGTYASHHIYGMQFKVDQYQTFIPRDVLSMERYLGSGAIKGIGPALAKRIVDQFGEETFQIIESNPHALADIKGISEKKAQEIAGIFDEQKRMRQVIIFLQEFGISLTYALKIYQEYEDNAIPYIRKNPYRLAEEISGIGFKIADEIATRIGFDPNSIERVKAALSYVLYKGTTNGHVYLEKMMLINSAEQLLSTEGLGIENALFELQLEQKVFIEYAGDFDAVYLIAYYNMEQYVANKLYDLTNVTIEKYNAIDSEIDKIQREQKIELDSIQREAIVDAMNFGVFVLTGGPGTGKTTTINAIIEAFVDRDMSVLLAAPTGRAAKKMTETTGYTAKTIHRLLEITMGKDEMSQKFERNEDYPLECDVVIIDETSMVDIALMYHLLKAIVPGTRLILVGDKDQLPSVGPGNVLKDIIKSNTINTITLEKIFRQAAESDIVINAHKINRGEGINLKDKRDFFFINRINANQGLAEIITLIKTRLPEFTGVKSHEGIQVLTPMRKGTLGVNNLNEALQAALNPIIKDKKEKAYRNTIFRENDKV
ncbi:MAG: AAA family ATPase, partial [Vallitaleaceae bacterium]|nr:AAA family ATPase [Vallitaleaceae bacterium]